MKSSSHLGFTAACLLATVTVTHADVTGSFEGQITGGKITTPINAAAALTQTGKSVLGTLALDGALPGVYNVNGKATPKVLKLSGFGPAGVKLSYTGKIKGEVVKGKVKLKPSGKPTAGVLTITRNAATADGSSCDAVYNANTTLFADQVLGQALTACTACHVTGGQAGPTRFHVTTNDALATARSLATMVNSANASASRIIEKPLNLVPHGGGVQITADSTQDQILRDWVALVANAHCN